MVNQLFRYVFTLNNYTQDEVTQLTSDFATSYKYLVFGREVGDSGTPHLQGFLILQAKKTLNQVRLLPGLGRAHLEGTRGTSLQAATYCKKDGDFDEFGELSTPGQRVDFTEFIQWVKDQEIKPHMRDVGETFPHIYCRYYAAAQRAIQDFSPRPSLVVGELRDWQRRLVQMLEQPADDRKVIFVVDENGNSGKSWLTRYLYSERDDVQRLGVGKRDDLAYAIDETKSIFMFDVPRGGMEFLQYSVLEMVKDRMVFSPKYASCLKILRTNTHVVVLCNEEPDRNRMTSDRYVVMNINSL